MPIHPSPAVLRACDVLSHLARHPSESFTVSELARVVDVPRATCDAILQALALRQYVTRHEGDRRYHLGAGSIALGEAARAANPVLRAAVVEAEELARASTSCVAVCVRDGTAARVVEVFDFAPLFAVRARVGQTIPLVPPFGAVFVAWNDDDAEAWLARAGASLERDERERYRRVLSEVRRRGYSISLLAARRQAEIARAVDTITRSPDSESAREARDEVIREMMHSQYLAADIDVEADVRVAQISAPVFDRSGRATTSILVPGPDYELSRAELREIATRLVAAAARATRGAGGLERGSASEDDARPRSP
jgi:DNA-binding IclR family transcriptional regulator